MASRAADADAARLRELGYEQELHRGLRTFDNVAIGLAAISPVVGLYAVAFVRHRPRGRRVGVGAADHAGRTVPAAVRLRGVGVGVPDRSESLAPPGAPFYQVWAATIVLGVICVAGLAYLAIAKPHERDLP
jgi:hypothetical protein